MPEIYKEPKTKAGRSGFIAIEEFKKQKNGLYWVRGRFATGTVTATPGDAKNLRPIGERQHEPLKVGDLRLFEQIDEG